MPNYQQGKVYKITSADQTYFGSTTQPTLAKRLAEHVGKYKRWNGGKGWYSSFPLIETGQYVITLIELCPCGSKDELRARERFHIETNDCVNKVIPGRTQKEYYNLNKIKIVEQCKEYYDDNRVLILDKKKDYYKANQINILEVKKDYREINREQIRERDRTMYELNKDKILERKRAYYQKKKSQANI